MKNTIHKLIICLAALAVILGTSSCLEKYPKSSIPEKKALKTYGDAEQHLVGIYAGLLSDALYSGRLTLLPDIQCDLVHATESFSNTYGDFWQWKIRSTDRDVEAVYGTLYSVIGNCNFYLDCIDEVMANETDDTNIDNLEDYTGQVYAIRALCYSELIKLFCKAYDPATARDELGVMLRTKYFEQEPAVRASLYDSYQLVLSDMEKAEQMISDEDADNTPNSDFFSVAAVYALHARVALYMQDWDAAIEYSSKLIDDMKHLFKLASVNDTAVDGASKFDYMWAYDEGPEVIFRVGFTTTSYGGKLGIEFLNFTRDFTYFYPDYVPSESVLKSYDSSDVRLNSYFADKDAGITIGAPAGLEWPLLVKYYGNRRLMATSPTTFAHVSMPKLFRLAEQYLIRAEAYCEKGDFGAASKDVTALRAKRYSSGGSMNLTSAKWKEQISAERVRELYMEGFRLQDLKRWGMGFKRKPQTRTLTEGSSLEIKADNPLFVWPIPQHDLSAPGSQLLPNESNK